MQDLLLARLLAGETIRGEAFAREQGVTRAAVWKQVAALRAAGFEIGTSEGGYRLLSCPDSLRPPVVRRGLDTRWAGCEIDWQPSVDSTNRRARAAAQAGAPHGALFLADEQTAGRGRRGRGWLTPAGEAVAMSLVLRPEAHPSRVAALSLLTALAAAEAVRDAADLPARIKWPNDVVCRGKKVAGILLEMEADEERVHFVVAGVGINVAQRAFPEELRETASSLSLLAEKPVSRADVVRAFLRRMEADWTLWETGGLMEAYRGLSATIGGRVLVAGAAERFEGEALDVTEEGALRVRRADGRVTEVLAGDVSVRGLMGYV